MASRKEYEMLFRLQAQLGGNFTGTFGKAQQQIAEMQKDIQALNKTQSNIDAYQKQQQAVEATEQKLRTYQEQLENLKNANAETSVEEAELKNKILAKQQQIDKTSASLEKQTRKLDDMETELKEAGVDTGNLTKESERLAAEMGDLKKKQEEVADGADSIGHQLSSAFEAAGAALAAAGIAAGMKEIYDAYKECVSVAGEFEASMSNVEALSGASAGELKQLSDMAKELGATTKFTAKESADAMGYMAMAGWDAEQMLSGMPGILSLAAASGEDLASVSDIVTDSMTAFGLTAADTARYADVLAATAANANTSVGVMGETFKYAAPVAGALGYSIEDVSTAIGLMANAGIKGSNAGTTLRNVFNGLLDGVTLTGAAFGECTVSAVQADGTMADFSETIDELRGYFDQMTEAERVNNAMTIAGQRGYAGLLSILNASEEDYAKLTASINNSAGAAQHMADIKMENMVGQLTLLNSASEAVQTTIGEQFTPMLADLYGWGANVLSEINSFLQQNPEVIKGVTIFVGVVGTATAALTSFAAVAKVIKTLDMAAAFGGAAGPLLIVTTALGAYTALMVSLTEAEQKGANEVRNLSEASRQQYDQIQTLRKEYEEACKVYGENSEQAEYLAWRLEDLSEGYEAGKQSIDEYVRANKELYSDLNNTLDTNRSAYEQIDKNSSTTLALVSRLQELASETEHSTASQEEMKAIIAELNREMPELGLNYDEVISKGPDYVATIDRIVEAETRRLKYEVAQEGYAAALRAQIEAARENEQAIKDQEAAQARYDAELAYYNKLKDAGITSYMPGEDLGTEDAKRDLDAAKKALDAYNDVLDESNKTLEKANADVEFYSHEMEGYVSATVDAAAAEEEAEEQHRLVAEAIENTTEQVHLLTEEYNAAYAAAYNSITGQYELWDEAEKVTAMKVGDINKALESQIEHWNAYNQNLASLRERTGEIEGLSDVISSFADGSDDSVAAIAGMATASDDDLKKMVKDWQELQKVQSETSDTIAEFKTDFTEQVQGLADDLAQQIRDLDLSDDAAASGRATIQGFIDAADEEAERVQTAYARLGVAAVRAMQEASGSLVGVNTHGWYYGKRYASGTDSAAPGLALVGEEGPELVMMRGGERVLNARQTEAIYDSRSWDIGGGYTVSFSPVYNITGSMDPEELEEVLREHDANLREQLEELLAELAAEKAGRAYQ